MDKANDGIDDGMLTLENSHIQDDAVEVRGVDLWVEAYLAWEGPASEWEAAAPLTEDSPLFHGVDPATLSTFGVWNAQLLDEGELSTIASSLSGQAWDEDDEEAVEDDDDDDDEDDEDEDFFADDDDDLDDDDEFEADEDE